MLGFVHLVDHFFFFGSFFIFLIVVILFGINFMWEWLDYS
uniref:Uncharacterized protein n=1 Tax=Rhizophora mucronata TaxID=61149 RepID=A0A2P2NTI6_RHIMU